MLTGWAIAHLVNYFVHAVNYCAPTILGKVNNKKGNNNNTINTAAFWFWLYTPTKRDPA